MGTYTVHVTNTIATDLELISNDFIVKGKGRLGKVNVSQNQTAADQSRELFSIASSAFGENLSVSIDFGEVALAKLPISAEKNIDRFKATSIAEIDEALYYSTDMTVEAVEAKITFDYTDMLTSGMSIFQYVEESIGNSILVDQANNEITFVVEGIPLWMTDHDSEVLEIDSGNDNDDSQVDVPLGFDLHQNFPNPFNPSTTIRFGLPDASNVSLVIYNLLGQTIKTLVNEEKSSGVYTVKWDGTDNGGTRVGSGVYIYVLRTSNGFVARRKMLLIR